MSLNQRPDRELILLGLKHSSTTLYLKEQAEKIVELKLRNQPENDGFQTPAAGNPVYKAMHACNAASRKELSRAHKFPAGKELTDKQVDAIVNLLIRWIVREYNFYQEERKNKQRDLSDF
jgi:hypothetical protein